MYMVSSCVMYICSCTADALISTSVYIASHSIYPHNIHSRRLVYVCEPQITVSILEIYYASAVHVWVQVLVLPYSALDTIQNARNCKEADVWMCNFIHSVAIFTHVAFHKSTFPHSRIDMWYKQKQARGAFINTTRHGMSIFYTLSWHPAKRTCCQYQSVTPGMFFLSQAISVF